MAAEDEKFLEIQRKIQGQLDELNLREESLTQNLRNMFDQRAFLDSKMKNISKLIPTLNIIKNKAQDLVTTINDISESSEKITDKIRSLDTATSHIDECQRRLSDLIDLEACSQGVQAAILDSDYEKGAAHIHRFLSMDQSLIQKTATDVENASNMMKSVRTLQDAANQLRAIVEHRFNEAVENEDLVFYVQITQPPLIVYGK